MSKTAEGKNNNKQTNKQKGTPNSPKNFIV